MPPDVSLTGCCTLARPQGWRFAFYVVAATSGAAAAVILALGTDPTPHRPAAASGKVSRIVLSNLDAEQGTGPQHTQYTHIHIFC
jgi:hypothetical protein